jgi:GNAT superfamily N-acetyltransferase
MSGPRCGRVTADTGLMTEALRVTACDTDETLAAASILFNEYRHHYSQSPDGDERTLRWLIEMVRSNMLTVYTASLVSAVEAAVIGLATAHPIPASLVMGCSWQLRDLYVLPKFRRHGAAAGLVNGVREAALAAGAIRLSLVTEPDNTAALGLYRSLGFRPIVSAEVTIQRRHPLTVLVRVPHFRHEAGDVGGCPDRGGYVHGCLCERWTDTLTRVISGH